MSSDVKHIVDFADSGRAHELLTEIYEHDLPPELADLVADYQDFEYARPPFMWKWVHRLAPENTLPCVEPRFDGDVPTDKTIAILFITLLDDVLEKRGDRATFEEASKVPFEHQSIDWDRDGMDGAYVAFTERVWDRLVDRIRRAPEYGRYDRLFRYDVEQAINAIEYTNLAIERPDLATMHDLELYESHNMVMFAYADIDLMHSPPAAGDELPTLRRAVWHAQQMARIGNWVSTWERELREGDYSSGVVVYALDNGIITQDDIAAIESGAVDHEAVADRIRTHDIEELFLSRWEDHREELLGIDAELAAIDLDPFVDGLAEVLRYHLASKGLK